MYDFQNKEQLNQQEEEEDVPIEDRFELADENQGAGWFDGDTQVDPLEYDNVITEDGEIFELHDGKRPVKGVFLKSEDRISGKSARASQDFQKRSLLKSGLLVPSSQSIVG